MFLAAARALSLWAPIRDHSFAALDPSMNVVRDISRDVALAVSVEAVRQGAANPVSPELLRDPIAARMWTPTYVPYRRTRPDTVVPRSRPSLRESSHPGFKGG